MDSSSPALKTRFTGCLLGGAVGDALGAPIEFLPLSDILRLHGAQGVQGYIQFNKDQLADFTDDTQMTLFTAEGLLQTPADEDPTPFVYRSYLNWLRTQRSAFAPDNLSEIGLLRLPELWKRQAPGRTCLTALSSGRCGAPETPINDSKGCGGMMRAAPCGLIYPPQQAFDIGVRTAAITHGHPSGYLSSGFFAALISYLIAGTALLAAVNRTLPILRSWSDHEETLFAVQNALDLADSARPPDPACVESLGKGWVGEEALAISLYAALIFPSDFRQAVLLAVNHSGDSDSTGAITGNLLGASLGAAAIPSEWLEPLELRAEIEATALALFDRAASDQG
jgi:ADP-ribosyl-[dinitrogen reductase] hydrolase